MEELPALFCFLPFFFFNHQGTRDSQRFCTLHAPGWRRVGGMEGLHIPVGWHQISHQWSGWGEGGDWEKIPHFPSWNRCSNTLSTCFSGHRSFQVPGDDNRLKQWHNQDTPMNPAFICRKKALRDSKTIRLLIELVPHSDPAVSPRWDLCVWDTSKDGSYLPESAVKMISAIAPWVKPNGRKELCKRLTGVNHSGLVATMYRTCGINKWMTGYGKELLPDIPIEWHTHTQ